MPIQPSLPSWSRSTASVRRNLSAIKKILRREPNFTELGIFFRDVERALLLQKFAKRTEEISDEPDQNILVKAGEENAGVVDIGDGWASRLKIESHIIQVQLSRSRAQPPALAESSATSLPWARGRNFV